VERETLFRVSLELAADGASANDRSTAYTVL
jgi:hypothetical protein